MKTPQLLVLLVTVLMHAAVGFPAERRGQGKHASWDDVNVVAHGLLQLGQGLKEHVDKTKAQTRDANAKLKALNATVAELERRQREQEEALRMTSREAEERGRLAEEAAEEAKAKVEEVKKQSRDVGSRMERLEEKVDEALREPTLDGNASDHAGIPFIQRLVAAQNRRIDQLVEKIKQQQDKLEKQSLHLQTLQSKVAHKRVKSHRRRDEETALRGDTSGLAKDCHELFVRGQRASGVYAIQPESSEPLHVLCEMTPEGGWTVIQKRFDGSENFDQPWENYRRGFGSLNGEFWLGLQNVLALSEQRRYLLQVELTDWTGQQMPVARYRFQLDGEEKNFALHLQEEASSEDQRESMTGDGVPFSTADRDNDLAADRHCAQLLSGGWWFGSCGDSNLNGRFPRRPSVIRRQQPRRQTMFWTSSNGEKSLVKSSVMKIRPASTQQ